MSDKDSDTTRAQAHPTELSEAQLDQANGGIIAVLIGLAVDKPKLGDGSVRPGITDGTSNTIIAG